MGPDDDRLNEPSKEMIEHLARRLVERYGPDAPDEAGHIVRLLTEDGNLEQAGVWTKVFEVCRRMVTRPDEFAGKR